MALDAILRSVVATVKSVTSSLQETVQHQAWTGMDAYGKPTYATAVPRVAIVELAQALLRMPDGQELQQRARLTFVDPITANGAANRREPIDPRDRITLADGTTGPILAVSGVADPTTGYPYAPEVALG